VKNFFWAAISAAIVAGTSSLIGAPAGFARAQGGPELVLTPDSGPCDATIQATGSGFPPDAAITFSLNRPYSEGYFASIGSTVSDASGAFSADVTLGEVGCTVASRDEQFDALAIRRNRLCFAASSALAVCALSIRTDEEAQAQNPLPLSYMHEVYRWLQRTSRRRICGCRSRLT
jgi:hypothetical protein